MDEFVEQNLRLRSIPLVTEGWARTFGRHHATVQRKEGAELKTYGVYLTPQEAALCDEEEDLENGYYEKLVLPVKT